MNKKFSTFLAFSLLAGAVSAQTPVQDAYRTFGTLNGSEKEASNPALSTDISYGTATLATGGTFSKFINFIDDEKLYQLEIGIDNQLQGLPASILANQFKAENENDVTPYVLIQERDYETGKVYLRAVPKDATADGAKLNASLWRIEYSKEDGVSGGYFRYVNKETGLALTFDHSVIDNNVVSELRDEITDWSWYTVNKDAEPFDLERVYSYLHNQAGGEVMYLTFADEADNNDGLLTKLADDGFKYQASAGKLVQAKVISSTAAGTGLGNVKEEALQLRPVVAMPFFMTAEQFNTRMDADLRANTDSFQFVMSPTGLKGADIFKGWFVAYDDDATVEGGLGLSDEDLDQTSIDEQEGNDGEVFAPISKQFNLTFQKHGTNTYLLADTARYQEATMKPNVSPSVKFAVKTPNENDGAYMKARYYFRATYFPTNDSLVIEPLNAAVQSDAEYDTHTKWLDSDACKKFFVNNFTKANTLVNDYEYDGSKTVSITAADIPGDTQRAVTVTNDGLNEFKVKMTIDRPFEYLTRTTVPSGLYYLNLANGDERQRSVGMSIVHNMADRIMYDTQAKNQDYSLMPSTMWVIKQLGCPLSDKAAKYVQIQNREYPGVVFEGQLYKVKGLDKEGNVVDCYRFIDRSAKYMNGYQTSGWIDGLNLRVADLLTITEVPEEIAYTSTHGYKMFNEDFLNDGVENNFQINWNNAYNDNLILKHVAGKNISVTDADPTIFEIAEATLPLDEGALVNQFGAVLDPLNKDFEPEVILPQLTRKAYLIKVKDQNLIDNDQLYLASVRDNDGRYYYKAMKFSDLDNYYNKLGVFYLKADQVHYDANGAPTDTAYVFVDINAPKALTGEALRTWDNYDLRVENGWMKAAVEAGSNMSVIRDNNLDDQPNDVSSAFYINGGTVNQYVNIAGDYNVGLNGNIKIYSKLNANNYLFEDCNDHNNVQNIQKIDPDFHYLGIESKGMNVEKNAALYVDEVVYDHANMQRYLFGVRVDSIPDGYICSDPSRIHGYWDNQAAAEGDGEVHYEAYNGYTAGWFMVNLEDSVKGSTNMMHNADLYKYNSYTRLGFVEGIHQVDGENEYLYVVNPGFTLNDLMTIKDNGSHAKYTTAGFVLDPAKLAVGEDGKGEYVTRHDIAGNLNTNHTFSLRKTNDEVGTASESEPFLLESYLEGVSNIGSFKGAWVKTENGIPVLAKYDTAAGEHEWNGSQLAEMIGQSGVFYFGSTTDEATANDEVTVSSVKVIALDGKVQIAGAQGKKVVITNILGQTVANAVITSDNATIAAPAGVVVVAVEGEEAVKAIVK
ncbi:DUF6383 domain-containing protein [Parabacteroides sp. AF17-28]|uniref:DUF6383 domain-containing protein n=1 Tax=Parabacteroides sp. AF17-28 TaxID=2292241 RepID=UPI000EFEB856|nr:DUF6383 domain-containing protein [Parabacteroides sp. AF17-28]